MFSFLKKSKTKTVGDLYVSVSKSGDPELFLDLEQSALAEIQNSKYVTMRVIVVEADNPQK